MSDVWEGGSSGNDERIDLGQGAYGEGLYLNEAFSIDRVVKLGIAALREQPALVGLAGFNLFIMQMIPQITVQLSSGAMGVLGELQGLDPIAAELMGSLVSVGVSLAFAPLQFLVLAGAIVGTGHWIRNEQVSIVSLYTSFKQGIRAFLYAILQGLISGFTAVICLTPGAAVMVLLIVNEMALLGAIFGTLLMMVGFIGVVYVTLGLVLGPYAIALDGKGPAEALAVSWEAARGARLTLFLVHLVIGVASWLACCMFLLPLIVVLAVQVAGFTSAWLLYARKTEEAKEWAFMQRNLPELR